MRDSILFISKLVILNTERQIIGKLVILNTERQIIGKLVVLAAGARQVIRTTRIN